MKFKTAYKLLKNKFKREQEIGKILKSNIFSAAKKTHYSQWELSDRIFSQKYQGLNPPLKSRYNKIILTPILAAVLTIGAVGGSWVYSYNKVFDSSKFTKEYTKLISPDANVVLDKVGEEIGTIRSKGEKQIRRVDVRGQKLDPLIKMLSAKEDKYIINFGGIEHEGFQGLLESYIETFHFVPKIRALKNYILTGDLQGGSELFCQLAKNIYELEPPNLWFSENSLTGKIEAKLIQNLNGIRLAANYMADKKNPRKPLEDMILDYVNTTYASGTGYGIELFIKNRFNKDIGDVLIEQDLQDKNASGEDIDIINMLAYYVSTLTRPEIYNPFSKRFDSPQKRENVIKLANKRKDLVINILVQKGYMNKSLANKCLEQDLYFEECKFWNSVADPSLVNIKEETLRKLRESGHNWLADTFNHAGLTIKTTLNNTLHDATAYFLQRDKTIINTLLYGYNVDNRKQDIITTVRPFTLYKGVVRGWKNGEVHINLGKFFADEIIPIQKEYSKTIYNKLKNKLKIGDIMPVGVRGFEQGKLIIDFVQNYTKITGAALVTDLQGNIIAMSGGNYLDEPVQLGSMYKLLITDLALRIGWSKDDILCNYPGLSFNKWSGEKAYSPGNYDDKPGKYPEHPALKEAFGRSINVPMVYLLAHLSDKMDIDSIYKEAKKSKISSDEIRFTSNKAYFHNGDWIQISKDDWPELLFEKIKNKRLARINNSDDSNKYEVMRIINDYSYDRFMRFEDDMFKARSSIDSLENTLKDVKKEYKNRKKRKTSFFNRLFGLELKQEPTYKKEKIVANINIPLDNFVIIDNDLVYDSSIKDNRAKTRTREELHNLFRKMDKDNIMVGGFAVKDYIDYLKQLEELKGPGKNIIEINKELIYYHPLYRSYLSVEIFKNYLAEHGIDRDKIKADLSLVLGTHETSIKDFNRMVRKVLITPINEDYSKKEYQLQNPGLVTSIKNKYGTILYQKEKPVANYNINNNKLFELMKYSRDLGTGKSLKSNIIKGTKTGTTKTTAAITGVLSTGDKHYVVTIYEAIQGGKKFPRKLVTGSNNAGKVLDNIANCLYNNYIYNNYRD